MSGDYKATVECPKKITVYRDYWMRGDGDNATLANQYGMCCLGQVCFQANVPMADLREIADPEDLLRNRGYEAERLVDANNNNSGLAHEAMSINDDADIDEATRENQLATLFEDHGIQLVFEDHAPSLWRAAFKSQFGLDSPSKIYACDRCGDEGGADYVEEVGVDTRLCIPCQNEPEEEE